MSNVHTFRPKRATVARSIPADMGATRIAIETVLEAALEQVDRLVAILDGMDGDENLEDGGDAEPSLGAPEQHHGSQVVWLRGSDSDREISQQDVTR